MTSVLDASLKSLSISSDSDAVLYALLDRDKFSEVIKLSTSGQKVPRVYLAYAQYRLGKEEECLQTLGDSQDRASLHLRVQALYRLERGSTNEIAILKQGAQVENEEAELAVNEMAMIAQKALFSKPTKDVIPPTTDVSHEYLFNYSLYLSANGKVEEAIEVLKKAFKALKALNLGSEEYDLEVAPLEAQLAYLTSDASRNQQAGNRSCDDLVKFLTSINFLETDNAFISHKKHHAESKLRPTARLFSFQDRYVAYNRIITMHSIGLSVKKAVKRYIAKYSDIDEERCAALTSLSFSKHTTQSLRENLTSKSENMEIVIALISKLIRQPKGVSKCISLIESLPAASRNQSPGVIGLWCALSDLTPASKSSEILEDALQNSERSVRIELLSGSIQRLLSLRKSQQNDETEVKIKSQLNELLALDPTNIVGQSAQSLLMPDSADEIIPLPDLSSIDVVSLELNNKKRAQVEPSTSRAVPKKRKTKTAEQLEQESKLDKERWLPKRDRSNYKPTKKDKERAKGSHQGVVVDESLSNQGPATTNKTGEVQRKKKGKKCKK